MIEKIVSGGQTGVDQAALDAALDLGIPVGGFCPKGKIDENGVMPKRFHFLKETETAAWDERTVRNLTESDGTLILVDRSKACAQDGTILTEQKVSALGKPYLVVDLAGDNAIQTVQDWVSTNAIKILNIAGPRASSSEEIHENAKTYLMEVLPQLIPRVNSFCRP